MTESSAPAPTESDAPPPAPVPSISFWERIKAHKILQWSLGYLGAALALAHGADLLGHTFHWPEIVQRLILAVLIVGLPLVLTLAWYHGHKGLKGVSQGELMIASILLVIGAGLLVVLVRPSDVSAESHAIAATAASPATVAATASPTAPRTAVAVLPFANLTGDSSKEYLGDGMAEELINTLTKVQGLKVPARTSTFAYKGRTTDIRQIAKDLGVGTILEGSVRAAGKRIRITAQLINATDGLHLWSETYDEEFTDLFKLQDKLATAIATALQPNLQSTVSAVVTEGPPTQDVEAYNLYLQGVSLVQRPSVQNAVKANEYFQQALARDPKFARSYAMLAQAQIIWGSLERPSDHFGAAERAARQALALDPSLAIGHIALASIDDGRNQFLEMEVHRRAAVSLAPNDGYIRAVSALLLPDVGYLKKGLEEAEKAYELAPANPAVVAFLGYVHAAAGHDREAAKYADAAVDLGYPIESIPVPETYEFIALRAKRYGHAADIFTKTLDMRDPGQARTAEVARLAYAALADPGQRNAALVARTRLYPTTAAAAAAGAMRTDLNLCMKSSYYYALMAAYDVAYGLANDCLDGWAPGNVPEVFSDYSPLFWFVPELRPFRQNPRFQVFATRLGLIENWQQFGPPDDCDLKDGKLTCH
jgi:TolB-like protein/tetratricopeptide (TPR) repeat protein